MDDSALHDLGTVVGVIVGVTVIIGFLFTVVVAFTRPALRAWIDAIVRERLDATLEPLRLELITMNGELSRVRHLEGKLENGLEHRTQRIEDRQQEIDVKIDSLLVMMARGD